MPPKVSTKTTYKKYTQREHVLERHGMYIGSVDLLKEHKWIYNQEIEKMEYKSVNISPGFVKIFDEILVNALDHKVRCSVTKDFEAVKHISVVLTPEKISVRNDGEGISVELHPEGMYIPEMIYGHLLTSSNIDKDGEERIVGGLNGIGSKATNIFSKEFTLELVDSKNEKKYKQTWKENMSICNKPSITKSSVKSYTEVCYIPDLIRFNCKEEKIPVEWLEVLATRVVDAAACAGKDCKVSLNGKTIASNTFQKYIELYLKDSDSSTISSDSCEAVGGAGTGEKPVKGSKLSKHIVYEQCGERWEIGAILTSDLHGDASPENRHISFVNGIRTIKGGKHVDYVSNKVLTMFIEFAKKKAKLDLTAGMLKDSLVWFVNATIVNPSFDSQTKETLTTPASKFGSTPEITDKFITNLGKIGLLEEAQALLEAKLMKDMKKTDGKKRSTIRGIPKLDDAIWAGGPKSSECTLILTEGDSAKTTAISGLKVVGREKFGVFPLKGKILNVKDISDAKKIANEELTNINKILGLEHKKVYTNLNQLRYGKIMIMTDQDVDGSHIKGLLMNLFHTEWPSLLKLGFICCMATPLLKAMKGKDVLCFYSQSEYETWKAGLESSGGLKGWKTKYYKGLGTSTAEEAREYFKTMNTVIYDFDEKSDESIDLAFNKKRADDRKDWLALYDKDRILEVKSKDMHVTYSTFVDNELIHFSNADNIRSLPHIMDGLKPSQRKILWSALKRNLTSEIRVAQLAGYVSEHAAYHHGEASLNGAIIGMAQNFVGSNNINLLMPNGQFGSRLMGGADSASPRYIHTQLEPIVKTLICKEDDAILKYIDDDGLLVEPETYMPVIPTILVNGALGIGTGYSTNIPPYNPTDLIRAIKTKLAGLEFNEELNPWWFGFKGTVKKVDSNTYITKGVYEFIDDDKCLVHIKELPVGTWTSDYKEFLESLLDKTEGETKTKGKKATGGAGVKKPETDSIGLKSYESAYNDIDTDFILCLDSDAYYDAQFDREDFEKTFKLTSTFKTSNMVAFDSKGHIHKYKNINEIIKEFYQVRLNAYKQRKEYLLKKLDELIVELSAKYKFVKLIVEEKLKVMKVSDEDLLAGLKSHKFPPLSVPNNVDDLKSYEYLLRMRIDRLKASSLDELKKEMDERILDRDELFGTSEEELWSDDLDLFEVAYKEYEAVRKSTYASGEAVVSKKKRGVKKA